LGDRAAVWGESYVVARIGGTTDTKNNSNFIHYDILDIPKKKPGCILQQTVQRASCCDKEGRPATSYWHWHY
jgi:hypothetical protein